MMVVLFPSCSSNLFCAPCSQVRRSRPKVVQKNYSLHVCSNIKQISCMKEKSFGNSINWDWKLLLQMVGNETLTNKTCIHTHACGHTHEHWPPPPPPPTHTHTQNPSDDMMFRSCVSWARYWKVERESTHAYWETKLIVPSNDVYYVCLCCQVTLLWRASCTVKHTLDERPSHQDLTWLLFLCTGEQHVEV